MEAFQRQLELEREGAELGIAKYREKLRNSDITDLPPGIRLMSRVIEPMTKAIQEFVNDTSPSGAGKYKPFLRKLDPSVIAYLVANRIIFGMAKPNPESLQNLTISITDRLIAQISYEEFKKEHPGYVYTIEKDNKWASESHRRATLLRAHTKLMGKHVMKSPMKHRIGAKLLDLFIESTSLVEKIQVHPEGSNKPKGIFRVVPTEETEEYLRQANGECELLQPLYFPMVIQPKDWNSPVGGGFVSNHSSFQANLVKTRNMKELLALAKQPMSRLYDALNTVQRTKWRINRRLYHALEEAWQVGDIAGLPKRELPPLPPKPWGDREPTTEELIAWKKQATTLYETHARERSKRIAVDMKLFIARRMLDEEAIYFVWTLDWRGRMYPVQQFVNPQTDDSGRALLEFSEGKPLGRDGAFWLAVHGANCAGLDKVSFHERVLYIVNNEEAILQSARDPMSMLHFWATMDDPFQFLAFCFEWEGYREKGNAYVSHLPVSLDGSCNGLQNFSAMLLDEVGGKATNLVPSDEPNDIYQTVADVLHKKVQADIAAGNPLAVPWEGKVTRKITKRGVMTTPYGVTRYGLKSQLKVEVEKIDRDYLKISDSPGKYYAYLAERLYEAIGEVVIAARVAMEWLQDVSKICSETGVEIRWTTPIGFKPVQDYRKQKLIQVQTLFGGMRVRCGLWTDTQKIDQRKMASGIAPNFVHSLDASHCLLTVLRCKAAGIKSFAMVHDSYGTHAADVSQLANLLREAFIEMYSVDILAKFRDEIAKQLPPEYAGKLPDLPEKGSLDLGKVRLSRYFFA